jgi:hypothetical protein
VKFGTNPAGAGILRVPNNTYAVSARNAANGADLSLIKANASDLLEFGVNLAAHTVAGALTVSTGGAAITGASSITGTLAQTGAVTIIGAVGITGNVVITGDLAVSGALNWGTTLTVDELILDTDGVAPAGTNAYVVSDNTGDLTANALTGKSVILAVAGNDEYTFNATKFILAAANDIQFSDDASGILDSNGNEVVQFEGVGSAVNYLHIINAVTANAIILENKGTNDRGFIFANAEGEKMLTLTSGTTAIYNLNILSVASGKVTLQTEGAADIGFDFETSESEEILTLTPVATATVNINITSAATGVAPSISTIGENDIGIKFTNAEAEPMLILASVATAVDYIVISNAAAAGKPIISTAGAVDIGIAFHTSEAEEILTLTPIATAVDYIDIKSGDGSTMPCISVAGDTAVIDLLLTAKSTGAIVLNNGTDPVVLKFMGAQAGYNNEIHDVNGNELIDLQGVASAVCEIGISNAVTGGRAIIKSCGETNSNLMIDTTGTGNILLALGGDEVLVIDDAAITFAAAADTAGHAVYIKTEAGGADGGAGTGRAGALLYISTGAGSAAATAGAVGGAGGALSIVSGIGAAGNTTGNGGVGGAIAITAGAGGNSGAGVGTGGTGGSVTLTAGAGGGAGGGKAGAPGKVVIGAGMFVQVVQTIDMADAAVQMTAAPGLPTGTLLTGNILYVDANSASTENLLLPYEADCTGMMLMIINTGGETINLQNDAGGALLTIATAETAMVACDGTTWRGFVGVV